MKNETNMMICRSNTCIQLLTTIQIIKSSSKNLILFCIHLHLIVVCSFDFYILQADMDLSYFCSSSWYILGLHFYVLVRYHCIISSIEVIASFDYCSLSNIFLIWKVYRRPYFEITFYIMTYRIHLLAVVVGREKVFEDLQYDRRKY